jgi:hypothetical protein
MKHWWNNTGTGKTKYSEKNLSECRTVPNKTHADWLDIEPGLRDYAAAYPEICSGGGQQIQLKTEGRENGDLGAVAP